MNDHQARGKMGPQLSFVIPAYNEEGTLARHFDILIPVLTDLLGTDWEFIVFDDGSLDQTAAVVRAYGNERIHTSSHHPNRGKGAAVCAGVALAQGDVILICAADMATPPQTLVPFIAAIRNGADIVIGNRKGPQSQITRQQTWLRRFLGNGFIRLAALLTSTPIVDLTVALNSFAAKSRANSSP